MEKSMLRRRLAAAIGIAVLSSLIGLAGTANAAGYSSSFHRTDHHAGKAKHANYVGHATTTSTTAAPVVTTTKPTSSVPTPPTVTTLVKPITTTTTAPAATINGKNCIAKPSTCGFPDATNTGYGPTGTSLTAYTGPLRITEAGTTIDGKLINGMLEIAAPNVTIKRSKIVFPHQDCEGSCWAVVMGGDNGLLQDVTIDGNGGACFVGALVGNHSTAQRVDISKCGDGFRADSYATIRDSYVHDLWQGKLDGACVDETHNDGIQATGGSHQVFDHNTVLNLPYTSNCPGVGLNATIGIGGEDGHPTDVTITNNLLDGGGFTVRLDPNATSVIVSGNRFGRAAEYSQFYTDGAAFTQSKNVWDDTGAALTF